MATQPQWSKDLQSLVDSIGFGEITPTIIKHRSQVTQIKAESFETIKYDNSEQALEAISRLLSNLFSAKYDGEVSFKVVLQNGAISRVGYYNERHTNYDQINKQKAQNANNEHDSTTGQ
jgi:hypothetical protein